MKVIILGAGVIGVTTAYVLATRGHEVHVIERGSAAGTETSFANGGQLSYSHAEPWANPGTLKKLPSWLFHEDSPLIFRLRFDPDMIKWGLKFLAACSPVKAERNCIDMLRLGLYSKQKMAEIREQAHIEFDFSDKGILHVFQTEGSLQEAIKQADFQAKFGCKEIVLTKEEVLAMEPVLTHSNATIVGGMYAPLDESGDAQKFCNTLTDYLINKTNAHFHFGVEIEQLHSNNGAITAVETNVGTHKADAYIVALGSYSPLLLSPLGIKLPIYPMKGYSITIKADAHCPNISITDGQAKIVFSRLGSRLRVAGTAEFAGYNTELCAERLQPILRAARTLFPEADWENRLMEWACLRPSTPNGPPFLGPTPLRNLYLNTGHGTLGWTQAAGSAYIVADMLEGHAPEILLDGLLIT